MILMFISPVSLLQYPQHTTEWAIPYENTEACLRDLRSWLAAEHEDPHGLRPHFPIEIRFSAPDEIFLSPSNGHRTCWLGIVQYKYARLLFLHSSNMLSWALGHTATMFHIESCSMDTNASYRVTAAVLTGRKPIDCSRTPSENYTPHSMTSLGCLKMLTHSVCSETNMFNDT